MTDTSMRRSGLRRGIGLLVLAGLAIAALSITPATAAKFLTKKKADKRYVNEGQAAASFGTVTAGTVTGGSFAYSTEQQNVLVVGAPAFSDGADLIDIDKQFDTLSAIAANDEAGTAGVSLPQGAVVTRVEAFVDNPSNGGFVRLKAYDPVIDTAYNMSSVVGTCSTGTVCTQTDTSIDQATIDNNTRHYGVLLYADSGESVELFRVAIHYTTTAVGPATG